MGLQVVVTSDQMTRNAPDPRRMSESEQGRAWVALGDRHAQTGWCRACGGLVAGSRGRCGNASPVAMHFDASAFTERRYSAARGGEESPPSIQQWTAAAAGPCGVAPVYPTPGLSRQRLLGGPEFPGLAWNERTSGRGQPPARPACGVPRTRLRVRASGPAQPTGGVGEFAS
ncbi:unnamed protein product [Lampetra fluviatilis]